MTTNSMEYEIKKFYAGFFLAVFDQNRLISLEISKSRDDLFLHLNNNFAANEKIKSNETINNIASQIQDPKSKFKISFKTTGTEFQKKVWESISKIPAGETRSYSQIAKEIGHPKSFRAVANACAANKIAILIPCHRVINKNGTLSGYKWGLDLKKEILDKEKE